MAEGGFQVGELAKLYFSDGVEVESLDSVAAVSMTNMLLEKNNVTIFEAAICHKNCLVRVDILQKVGNELNLYEVKAKSFNSEEKTGFLKRNGEPKATWKDYLYDVAFQKWVCEPPHFYWSMFIFR